MLPVKTLPYVERGLNFCEQFQTVTILFSDIVSYTNMAAQMDPMAVVNMLNELYFMYDRLVEKHNVYKVETIGDAYMVAAGHTPDDAQYEDKVEHFGTLRVLNFAVDMVKTVAEIDWNEIFKDWPSDLPLEKMRAPAQRCTRV